MALVVHQYDLVGSLVFIVSAIGIACHFCITRTHPAANKTKLDQELNSLFISLMLGLAFGFSANVVLLALCIEGDWTFSEVLWGYWFEIVMVSGFTTWTITTLDQFDSSDAGFAGKSVAEVKQAFVKGQLSVGAFFTASILRSLSFLLVFRRFPTLAICLLFSPLNWQVITLRQNKSNVRSGPDDRA